MKIGVDFVGGLRTGRGSRHRTRPPGRRQARFGVHREARLVHPDRAARHSASQRPRPCATAFTHRDSRAGEAGLHTHVTVATKVQTRDGRWLSIDGQVLFKANVAASETYNTALEQHLRDSVLLRFAGRSGTDRRSGRSGRSSVSTQTESALVDPPRPHRSPPRRASHPVPERSWPTTDTGRSVASGTAGDIGDPRRQTRTPILAEQHTTWLREAAAVLGGRGAVGSMVRTALAPPAETATIVDARWVAQGSQSGLGRHGGDVADVACPGRSATTGPHHRRAC